MSQSAWLENAILWYSQVVSVGQPFYIELPEEEGPIQTALDTTGASYTILSTISEDDPYPRVTITTNSWIPFVSWGYFVWERDTDIHAGFTAYYLCVFGSIFSLGDSFDFQGVYGQI